MVVISGHLYPGIPLVPSNMYWYSKRLDNIQINQSNRPGPSIRMPRLFGWMQTPEAARAMGSFVISQGWMRRRNPLLPIQNSIHVRIFS